MTREEILSHVDHTLLKPEATWPQIQTLCDEAIANHTASVCINTCYVKQAVEYMAGRIPVCCVVGFPLGAMDTASKAFEAKTAIENGASEVDMVINIGRLKNKEYDAVREDIRAVKQAVGDKILKVIIETCLLTEEEKEEQARLRKEYIASIKNNMRAHLNNISIREKDGTITDLGKKYGGIKDIQS